MKLIWQYFSSTTTLMIVLLKSTTKKMAIHLKEALAVVLGLVYSTTQIAGKRVRALVDNWAVVKAWENRHRCGGNVQLGRYLRAIHEFIFKHQITFEMVWVSTDKQLVDAPSREVNYNDARIRASYRDVLQGHGFFNLDAFADVRNKVFERFISNDFNPEKVGYDAMAYPFEQTDFVYAYPPSSLLLDFINVD